MARFVLFDIIPGKLAIAIACFLLALCVLSRPAVAQHGGGGHVGGGHIGGGHAGGGVPHAAAPPATHAPALHGPASGSHFTPATPVGRFNIAPLRYRPIRRYPPIYGIYPIYGYPYWFGGPFYRYGFGWGWNSCLWPSCNLLWMWGYGYAPYGWYGWDNYVPSAAVPYAYPQYAYPEYSDGGERRDLPQLYLKDGTVYAVTDYWLVDNELHFTLLEDHGTKAVEHVIAFDELDLQKTIDMASLRGFRFVLRNEPVEQYLRDHPDETPPSPPRLSPN